MNSPARASEYTAIPPMWPAAVSTLKESGVFWPRAPRHGKALAAHLAAPGAEASAIKATQDSGPVDEAQHPARRLPDGSWTGGGPGSDLGLSYTERRRRD